MLKIYELRTELPKEGKLLIEKNFYTKKVHYQIRCYFNVYFLLSLFF